MPMLYPIKRIARTWKLFLALLIGVALASAFFAGIVVKANLSARQALDQQLSSVNVDMEFSAQLNASNFAHAPANVSAVKGITDLELISRVFSPVQVPVSENETRTEYVETVGLFNSSSRVNEGWLNKPEEDIGENETYILADSSLAEKVKIGDIIQTALQFSTPKIGNTTTVYLNLTVVGFADLTDEAYSLASGNTFYVSPLAPTVPSQEFNYKQDLLLVSFENTIQKIWSNMSDTAYDVRFLVWIDREALISPWDTQTSADNIRTVADNIQNTILANFEYHTDVQNNLGSSLTVFQYNFSGTLLTFILISLPVFFVAWYMGSTVSDVAFNMRRREIGLLSTKGLSSGQIQRMFFSEALLIGLVGGLIGVVGGLLLNQVFTGFNLETLFSSQMLNPYTIVFTVGFGVVLAFFSVFFSARRASRLPTVNALRDYMPIEADKPYRKRLPWLAFLLGTYKIVLFILGVNLPTLLTQASFSGGNFLISIILGPLILFDALLTFTGPLLFFWGTTKLLIQNSLKFQQLTSGIFRVMGDLGALAAKNVRRNPARSAAIAFIIALIIGYGVQITGQLASEQDYLTRRIQYNIGADVAVSVINGTEAPAILDNIVANVSGIQNATMECTINQNYAGTQMRTVDPDSWLVTAYYEKEWFSGASIEEAFNQLRSDNMTIILERRVAQNLNLKIGDEIGIDFASGPRKLRVVGFFGPEAAESGSGINVISGGGGIGGPVVFPQYYVQTWSFVPRNLFNMSSPYSDAFLMENFQTNILIKLNPGVNGTQVAEKIRNLNLEIYGVESLDEDYASALQTTNSFTFNNLQTLDVQRLGLVFEVLAASVGTALISIVSIKERNREATLMSVRGLSYRQLVWMFLTENIAVISFSIVLGLSVGLIIVYGNVTSANAAASELVKRRMVFPNDAIVTIASCIGLIYASTILPIIVMTRQYVTKLDRMIRTR
jgi:ABC-type lipoprotein release transport system permease subunit